MVASPKSLSKKKKLHAVVVSSRSQTLSNLINQVPSETIEITDFSHQIFSQLIKWIYGGKFTISQDDAEELGRCASVYQVTDLYEECLRTIKSSHKPQTLKTEVSQPPSSVFVILSEIHKEEEEKEKEKKEKEKKEKEKYCGL